MPSLSFSCCGPSISGLSSLSTHASLPLSLSALLWQALLYEMNTWQVSMVTAPRTSGANSKRVSFQRMMASGAGVWPRVEGHVARLSTHLILTSPVHVKICPSVWHLSESINNCWESHFLILCFLPASSSLLPFMAFNCLHDWIVCSSSGVMQFWWPLFSLVVMSLFHVIQIFVKSTSPKEKLFKSVRRLCL